MKQLKADPNLVAGQLGRTLDVNQNVYTQLPVESRLVIVNWLENLPIHNGVRLVFRMERGSGNY